MNIELKETDSNEFSGNSFVTACMLLVMNMFANDLGHSVEYLDRIDYASSADIFINYDNDEMVYNKSLVSSEWPHYQNRYCFIYSNSRRIRTFEMLTVRILNSAPIAIPFIVSWIYHYLILHFR